MRNSWTSLSVAVFATAVASSAAFADVVDNRKALNVILIQGTITPEDAQIFDEITEGRAQFNVLLESEGGDLRAAMRIGRRLRAMQAYTVVFDGDDCYGSCALIWMAGLERINKGRIGLHRPYLSGDAESAEELGKYLQEMGIIDSIHATMIATPPEKTRVFHGWEISMFVPEIDRLYKERRDAKDAERYELNLEEYRRRRFQLSILCRDAGRKGGVESAACRESVMWGLDAVTYRERKERVGKMCQKEAHLAAPHKNPASLEAAFQEFYACERRIMHGG